MPENEEWGLCVAEIKPGGQVFNYYQIGSTTRINCPGCPNGYADIEVESQGTQQFGERVVTAGIVVRVKRHVGCGKLDKSGGLL